MGDVNVFLVRSDRYDDEEKNTLFLFALLFVPIRLGKQFSKFRNSPIKRNLSYNVTIDIYINVRGKICVNMPSFYMGLFINDVWNLVQLVTDQTKMGFEIV